MFGEDEAKPIVYIGQTEDARTRLESHNKRRTFWKTAIFLVSKTQNFTQAHIRYLEWYCLQRAKEVNRYTLDNDQIPSNSIYVPEPMEAELLDVFETVSTLVSTLGYPVFESLASRRPASIKFFCRGGGSEGRGELVEDGFVVLAGSRARMEVVASATASGTPKREALLAAGVLEQRDGDYFFTQDYLFGSPSTAAAVVLGRTANGWVEWKDKNGLTLSEVHRDTDDASDIADDE